MFRFWRFRFGRFVRSLILWTLVICLIYWCADNSALVKEIFHIIGRLLRDLISLLLQ